MTAQWSWRTFWHTFILTLCVLGLISSFLLIEYNIRRTSYGQVDFGVHYSVTDGLPTVTVDGEVWKAPAAVATVEEIAVPAPLRLLAVLWQWENAAAEQLWKTVLDK